MDPLASAEYHALRHTIAVRGTLRPALVVGGVAAWAGSLAAVVAVSPQPLAVLIPLLVLLATFEAARQLHAGVERIGRYLTVFYEQSIGAIPLSPPAWETAVGQLPAKLPGAGGDPLFTGLFATAIAANAAAGLVHGPVLIEVAVLVASHGAALILAWLARRGASHQRDADQAAFRRIRKGSD